MVKYRFIDDEPEEKHVARFRYVGSDEYGRKEKITAYGTEFELGEVAEVADEYAANKLRGVWKGAFEEVEGDDDDNGPKKRGRPRKTDEEREQEKAEREAEKAEKEAEREAEKEKRKAEKEGAQPKTSEEDFNEGEPF